MRKEPIIIGTVIDISTQLTQSVQCEPVMFKSQGEIIEVIPEVTMEITNPYIDFPTNPICGREQRRLRRKQQRKNNK